MPPGTPLHRQVLADAIGVLFFLGIIMNKILSFFKNFSVFEAVLWSGSVLAILLSFFLCGNTSWLNLTGSLIGVTSLLFLAKGNVIGNFLCVAFSVFYGVISYFTHYYGEMITYLGMTMPVAILSIVTWLRNSYGGKKTQVTVNRLSKKEYALSFLLAAAVTVAFYFLLRALNTANLIWSAASVLTSFYASYLNMRRSPDYALAYAANDIVLIVLWSLVISQSLENVAMVVCFSAFLLNDLYGFFNWLKMRKKQSQPENNESAS